MLWPARQSENIQMKKIGIEKTRDQSLLLEKPSRRNVRATKAVATYFINASPSSYPESEINTRFGNDEIVLKVVIGYP